MTERGSETWKEKPIREQIDHLYTELVWLKGVVRDMVAKINRSESVPERLTMRPS